MCHQRNKPQTEEDAIFAIRTFVKKVNWFKDYSFFRDSRSFVEKYTIGSSEVETIKDGSSNESIDAILLHLRQFLIGNEPMSLNYVGDVVNLINAPDELKTELLKILGAYNKWECLPSGFLNYQNRALLNLLTNTHRLHANDKTKIAEYEELMNHSILAMSEKRFLVKTMVELLNYIDGIYRVYSSFLESSPQCSGNQSGSLGHQSASQGS